MDVTDAELPRPTPPACRADCGNLPHAWTNRWAFALEWLVPLEQAASGDRARVPHDLALTLRAWLLWMGQPLGLPTRLVLFFRAGARGLDVLAL